MSNFLWLWNTASIVISGAQDFIAQMAMFKVVSSDDYNWIAVENFLRCDSPRGELKQW